MNRFISIIAALFLAVSAAAYANTYTYRYSGPTFTGGTDHVEVSFTAVAPLAPSKSYLSAADAGIVSGAVTVVGPAGVVSGFTLPLSTFQIHTNGTATGTTPGIDSWFILGDASNLTGASPTMTGVHFQSYTMNTMAFIPGSDVSGATGLVTGHYNYDQATQTTFYASCSGIPGCTLAGNGQPYVGNYSGIINPSNTSAANWTLVVGTPPPPPPPALALSGSLPNGTVGVAYSSSALVASGGVPPYAWLAAALPAGLAINASTGKVSGTPTSAGAYAFTVTVTDSAKSVINTALSMIIDPASTSSCTKPSGAKSVQGKNKITAVGAGYIVVGSVTVQVPTCTVVSWNGAQGFAIGQRAEYQGYASGGMIVAQKITIN